jgi:hypothetical protein
MAVHHVLRVPNTTVDKYHSWCKRKTINQFRCLGTRPTMIKDKQDWVKNRIHIPRYKSPAINHTQQETSTRLLIEGYPGCRTHRSHSYMHDTPKEDTKSSVPYTQQRTTGLSIIYKKHGSETIDRTKQLMTRKITKVTPSRTVMVIT